MNAPFAARLLDPGVEREELAPPLERRRLECYIALLTADIFAILTGFLLSGYLYEGSAGFSNAMNIAKVVLPVYLAFAFYNSAYSLDSLRNVGAALRRKIEAFLLAVCAIVLMAFYTKSSLDYSRFVFTAGSIGSIVLLGWARLQMRSFISWRCGPSVVNELLIEDGGPDLEVPGALRVCANSLRLAPDLNDPFALHRIGLVLRNIDRVIVSCPTERRVAWSVMLKGANVEGEIVDDEVARLGAQGARTIAGEHGLLLVSVGPLDLRARVVKRLFDLIVAGAAIVVLSPVLLLCALAIKLDDGGRVLFVQRRVGRGNRFFNMYKFRSMSEAAGDGDGLVSTARNDRRVTRIGRFLRRTSLDELPQLFNVVLGDMSMVGPRPHALGSQAGDQLFWEVDPRYWQRHSLKPGLSGLAQIRGYRGATECRLDLVQRLGSDLEYLEGWTILRDIKILLLTLRVLVHDRAF